MYSTYLALFDERFRIFSTSGPGTLVDRILKFRDRIYFVSAVAEFGKITHVLKNTLCLFCFINIYHCHFWLFSSCWCFKRYVI